uniref:Uncharacterized protein n=1 Tax=Enterococcus faecium TaxID=1352 RepID=A0A810JZM2_ENTFC|nr:hypothetical protein [Enterococcus faecium]
MQRNLLMKEYDSLLTEEMMEILREIDIDFTDVEFGYFISVVLVDNWEIEKGMIEEPIFGKNSQYYFILGDNFDSSDIAMFISDAKENVMEKISYETIKDIHQHIEIYRDIRSNEFVGIVKMK